MNEFRDKEKASPTQRLLWARDAMSTSQREVQRAIVFVRRYELTDSGWPEDHPVVVWLDELWGFLDK